MKLRSAVGVMLLSCGVLVSVAARAEEARGQKEEQHRAPNRQPPPQFRAHPPGAHPQGPMVRQHPTRVLAPRVVVRGHAEAWPRWEHPEFARPAYYWDWRAVRSVTCIAEDSYGDQYPVTMSTWSGFGLVDMTAVEDNALDRCYSESGGDPNCYLLTCSHL